jgi:hypothetical protein
MHTQYVRDTDQQNTHIRLRPLTIHTSPWLFRIGEKKRISDNNTIIAIVTVVIIISLITATCHEILITVTSSKVE